MPNNSNQVTSDTSENVQIAGMGSRPSASRTCSAVHTAAHVGATNRQPDPNTRGNRGPRRRDTAPRGCKRNLAGAMSMWSGADACPASRCGCQHATGLGHRCHHRQSSEFKSARHFAAFLGPTPTEHSMGALSCCSTNTPTYHIIWFDDPRFCEFKTGKIFANLRKAGVFSRLPNMLIGGRG